MSVNGGRLIQDEHIVARRRQIDLWQDLCPLHIAGLDIAFRAKRRFHGCSWSLVAGKVAGINIKPTYSSGKT